MRTLRVPGAGMIMPRTFRTALVLCVGLSTPLFLSAQGDAPLLWADGGAGLMIDTSDDVNGPILYFRSLRQLAPWFLLGPRFEFRDDIPSGGRAQVVSGGAEAHFTPLEGTILPKIYVPMHVALDLQYVQGEPAERRVDTGVFPRITAGIGVKLNVGASVLRIERRWSLSSGGDFNAVVVGLSGVAGAQAASGGRIHLVGHDFFPVGGTYEREPDWRGYSIVYERDAGNDRWVDAWRGSLGVSFVDFASPRGVAFSTGMITALVGPVKTLASGGSATLNLIGQMGATHFAEGSSDVSFPLAGLLGIEGEMAVGGVALLLRASVLGTNGPVGWVLGLQPGFGVAIGM